MTPKTGESHPNQLVDNVAAFVYDHDKPDHDARVVVYGGTDPRMSGDQSMHAHKVFVLNIKAREWMALETMRPMHAMRPALLFDPVGLVLAIHGGDTPMQESLEGAARRASYLRGHAGSATRQLAGDVMCTEGWCTSAALQVLNTCT